MENASPEPGEPGANEIGKGRKPRYRVPAAQILPSDRHSFVGHFDVLKRFVTLTGGGKEGIDAERVEGEGVPAQAGSLNVRFLKSVGLLSTTDRGLYIPTTEAVRFVTARSVSDDRARPILKALLEPTWFVGTAKSVLQGGTSMSEDQFLGELAIAAQTDREKKGSALRVILEYLVWSGHVLRDEKGLRLSAPLGDTMAFGQASPETPPPDASAVQIPQPASGPGSTWHVIQTEDFILKIRSDEYVIDDLIAHLEPLRRKSQRARARIEVPTGGPADEIER